MLTADPRPPAAERFSILIVDDTLMQRRILAAIVEGLGMDAHAVDSGAAALALCRTRRFDAVLMDIEMPGLSGLDATRAIRALGGAAGAAPIIAVTSSTRRDLGAAARKAGMNAYLQKPVRPAVLAEALWAVLLARPNADALTA